jgi:hypothetical protein
VISLADGTAYGLTPGAAVLTLYGIGFIYGLWVSVERVFTWPLGESYVKCLWLCYVKSRRCKDALKPGLGAFPGPAFGKEFVSL